MEIFHHKLSSCNDSPGNAVCNSTPPPKPPTVDCGTQSGVHRSKSNVHRSKSNLYGPCSKSSLRSSRRKQVRGPSTPLGCRLAALRMTDQKIAGDWRLTTDLLPPNQTCQSRSKNSESKISPASPPRGQINFHGQACQCRSMVVHGHDAARVRRPDHGVQCFRRDGQGTVWFALSLRLEAIVLVIGRDV